MVTNRWRHREREIFEDPGKKWMTDKSKRDSIILFVWSSTAWVQTQDSYFPGCVITGKISLLSLFFRL